MPLKQLKEVLLQTLQDDLLSRNERELLLEAIVRAKLSSRDVDLLRNLVFDLIRPRFSTPEQVHLLDWLQDVQRVMHRSQEGQGSNEQTRIESEVCFSPGMECVNRIRGLLRAASHTIDICVFTITDDRIADEIVAAHQREVKIRLITDNEKAFDLGSDIQKLQEAKIPVRVDQTEFHMHHKYAIFDQKRVLSGSYNWTRGAAEQNEENLIVSNDPKLVASFSAGFESLWESLGK